MDSKEVAEKIITLIGGENNISQCWHCITRLRFNLHNNDLVNENELREIPWVLGVNFQGKQLQIILGSRVSQVYEALNAPSSPSNGLAEDEKNEKTIFDKFCFQKNQKRKMPKIIDTRGTCHF